MNQLLIVEDSQLSRERELQSLVEKSSPRVRLHSRVGRGALRACLPRLRFDRRIRFFWLKWLVANANDLNASTLALTITGLEHGALDLRTGWSNIEIHVYDVELLSQAKTIGEDYICLSGMGAVIVVDFREKKSLWRPVYSFTLAIALISLCVLAVRIFSITTFKNLFNL